MITQRNTSWYVTDGPTFVALVFPSWSDQGRVEGTWCPKHEIQTTVTIVSLNCIYYMEISKGTVKMMTMMSEV